MVKIGITGGIATGKSTVCKIIEELGYPVFYSDDVAKEIINTNPEIIKTIKKVFGEESYIDGVYNTKLIGKIVFNDKTKLDILNSIVKYNLLDEFNKFCNEKDIVFAESALIFEHNKQNMFKYIVCTYCSEKTQINRLTNRNNFTLDEINARLKNQLLQKYKISHSNFLINTEDGENIEEQINNILKTILLLRKN